MEPNDALPAPPSSAGQLSADGAWYWDGTAWLPAVSPNGAWRWDGSTWQATGPATAAVHAQLPWPTADDLDDPHAYATGGLPPKVDQLPAAAVVKHFGLALGTSWVARRPVAAWHLMDASSIATVAVVPPTSFNYWMHSRSIVAPLPDLALRDRTGAAMRINATLIGDEERSALSALVQPGATVTMTAARYLVGGEFPGDWNHHYQFFWKRFG